MSLSLPSENRRGPPQRSMSRYIAEAKDHIPCRFSGSPVSEGDHGPRGGHGCKLPGVADLLAGYPPACTLSDVPREENASPPAVVPNPASSNAWQSVSSHHPLRNLDIQPGVSPPRTRIVKNPDITSHVRQLGACYRCRINKSRVSHLYIPHERCYRIY